MPGTYDVATVTAAYTVPADIDDQVILADATAAAFTITLADAGQFAGKRLAVKRINSAANNVTIAAPTPTAPTGGLGGGITSISVQAAPVYTTASPHNLQVGQSVTIAGASSITGANGTATVTAVGAPTVPTGGGSATGGSTSFTLGSQTTSGGPYNQTAPNLATVNAAQQLIDGAATLAITVNNSTVELMSNGVNYYVLVKSLAATTV